MSTEDWHVHVGWKAIARRLGVKDIRTAKALTHKYRVPVYKIGKFPRLDETVFRLWVVTFQQYSAENAGRTGPQDWMKAKKA